MNTEVVEERLDLEDRFIHLSDTFKFISHYRRRGHQIGRKVGDMLEVLTLAAIFRNQDLRDRLVLEPKLEGFSGAGHKVEFAIYDLDERKKPIVAIPRLLSFIECKKVGVEQTVNATFKKAYSKRQNIIPYGDEIDINFNPRWAEGPTRFQVLFGKSNGGAAIKVKMNDKLILETPIGSDQRFIFGLTNKGAPFFLNNESSLRDIADSIRTCKVLQIEGVTENGIRALLNDCLTGPQTPEKAKQASYVALDVRKGRFGQYDKRPNERQCVSILVLTEFSHWEPKSIKMIDAAIDHNLVIDDALVIEALGEYEGKYGLDFLDNVTKEFFMSSTEARAIAVDIVERRKGKIFRDVSDNKYKEIVFMDGEVAVRA